jgi:hypothetical protein
MSAPETPTATELAIIHIKTYTNSQTVREQLLIFGVAYITFAGTLCKPDDPDRACRLACADPRKPEKNIEISLRRKGQLSDYLCDGYRTLNDAMRALAGLLFFGVPTRRERSKRA